MINPQHLNIENCLYIIHNIRNKKKIFLTTKADGLRENIKYNNINYLVEMINNNYYIFDLFDYKLKIFENYHYRLKYIYNNLKRKFFKEFDNLNDFYEFLNSNPIFIDKINNYNLYLKPVSILNFLNIDESDIFDFLDNFKVNSEIENDGSILYIENENYPIKFKNKKYLSIDLKYYNDNFYSFENKEIKKIQKNFNIIYHNNAIYEYNLNNKKIFHRKDKNNPNKSKTINDICYLYKNYDHIKFKNIINYIDNKFYFNYYKLRDRNITYEYKFLCDDLSAIFMNFLNKKINNNKSVLDIGCGSSKVYNYLIKRKKNIKYYGLDCDHNILIKKCFKKNMIKIYGNPNYKFEFFSNYLNVTNIKYVIFSHTLYYLWNNFDIIIKKLIEKFKTFKIIIVNIFYNGDKLININDDIKIEISKEKSKFKYPWLTKEIEQDTIIYKNLLNIMRLNGFKLESYLNCEKKCSHSKFYEFYELNQIYCFTNKINDT